MKKVNLLRVFTLLLGFTLAFGFSAFKAVKTQGTAIRYVFDGTSSSQSKSAVNYTMLEVNDPEPDCSGSALPCIIEVDGNLQTWLNARTESQILSQASATKD
ncbi:hypothetical protein A5893_02310 [Pedobacter psychrophilus]|uniref:Uncharacterized protein n=1 Tax=Pedobacter psychrophilus TaxID=1826909 RepID=A0A179DN85_9SPHI|nr:hypothetical protein [Pedobacter psychrophilus]OAQ41973.1 hypothetical protein A5893_02310 [Pedobacter psychrophilus]